MRQEEAARTAAKIPRSLLSLEVLMLLDKQVVSPGLPQHVPCTHPAYRAIPQYVRTVMVLQNHFSEPSCGTAGILRLGLSHVYGVRISPLLQNEGDSAL